MAHAAADAESPAQEGEEDEKNAASVLG